MRELSLHILDLVQNSIRAKATFIQVSIEEKIERNELIIRILDNGSGMKKEVVEVVSHPFVTSRTTRKVGMGIPFMAQMCQECNGNLTIESTEGKGTLIDIRLEYNHIDRLPLGNIADTIVSLILANPDIHYRYSHAYENHQFIMDTQELKEILGDVSLNHLQVIEWIKQYIIEQVEAISREDN